MQQVIVGRLVAVVLALAGSAAVGWRVLAPAEVSAPAKDAYPAARAARFPGVTGQTPAMPLIVDGRIRVYAAARQVRADAPVHARVYGTPRWSYRRWPQQVAGVVAVGATVISRWSDGRLVALDARTGKVAWRADGPPAAGYDGRRTGASTVLSPPGLHTSGRAVVVSGGRRLLVLDAATGAVLRRADLPDDCATDGFTTAGGGYVCGTTVADITTADITTGGTAPAGVGPAGVGPAGVGPAGVGPAGAAGAASPTGRLTPLGCSPARSACVAVRDAAGRGWLTGGRVPRRAPALDPPGSTVADGLALTVSGTDVVARAPVTGAQVWRWRAAATDPVVLLAAQPGAVHLLTGGRVIITLRAATGVPRSRFVLNRPKEPVAWDPGAVQATGNFVAVERLRPAAERGDSDADRYYSINTVIIAAI